MPFGAKKVPSSYEGLIRQYEYQLEAALHDGRTADAEALQAQIAQLKSSLTLVPGGVSSDTAPQADWVRRNHHVLASICTTLFVFSAVLFIVSFAHEAPLASAADEYTTAPTCTPQQLQLSPTTFCREQFAVTVQGRFSTAGIPQLQVQVVGGNQFTVDVLNGDLYGKLLKGQTLTGEVWHKHFTAFYATDQSSVQTTYNPRALADAAEPPVVGWGIAAGVPLLLALWQWTEFLRQRRRVSRIAAGERVLQAGHTAVTGAGPISPSIPGSPPPNLPSTSWGSPPTTAPPPESPQGQS